MWFLKLMFIAALVLSCGSVCLGENIDPLNNDSQYAYSENTGWVNFEPDSSAGIGAAVTGDGITGYAWSENAGWIVLSCQTTATCGEVEYGISNDGKGNLSGLAWGENIGWIDFDPRVEGDSNDYGVKIDTDGSFSGWAYGETIGWIHFQDLSPVAYKVQTSWVYCECIGDMNNDGWISPTDVSALVSQLLPHAGDYYWTIADAGDCGDPTGDGWKSPTDLSALISKLLPYSANHYWLQCPQ